MMGNGHDTTPHDWLGKDKISWHRWIVHIATYYPIFAESINSIKNPLSKKEVFNYFEEDTYLGVLSALLWLDNHRRQWLQFRLLPSESADRIRYCVSFLANLLEEQRMDVAFYSLLGYNPSYKTRIPDDIETFFIVASPPWEMLHFIGYKLPSDKRPPILDMRNHFSMLKEVDPRLAFRWYSEWKDGKLEADKEKMDLIYFDYCQRLQNQQ